MLNNLFKCTGSKIKVLFIKILFEQVKEQSNFICSLEAFGRMRLKKCVWRSASKGTSLKKSSWRYVIKSKVIRSNGHQKHLTRSYFTRVDKVQCTKCTTTNSQPPSLQLCLYIKTRLTVRLLQTLLRFKWNGFEISFSKDKYQIRQKINDEESKLQARQVDVTAKFSTSLKSSINRDEDLENIEQEPYKQKGQYSVQNVVNKTSTT